MECEFCQEFREDIEIHCSKVLDDLITKAAAAVASGRMIVVTGDLQWFDTMECDLKCARCSKRFELICETYHGSGTWRTI